MKQTPKYFTFILFIVRSIPFYPITISIIFIGLALIAFYLDSEGLSTKINRGFSFLIVTDQEIALSILGTLAGGIFALIIFGFTMVMLLLNQTSFTPRMIPGLITHRGNQKYSVFLSETSFLLL